jgi:hypothetical protein
MISLKEWAESIKTARIVKETREKKDAAVQFTKSLVHADGPVHPVVRRIQEAGSAWYSIGMKSFKGLTLSAADDDIVEVRKNCDVCDHPYAVKIKAWKIRSCDVAAAPCPRCSAYQILDLDAVRKENFGAC